MQRALRRLLAVLVAAGLLAAVAPPAAAASGDLWAALAADKVGWDPYLALGPGGVHHLAIRNEYENGSFYATDRGNTWTTTTLNGIAQGVAVDAAGTAYVLTVGPGSDAARLTTNTAGTLATQDVPGTNNADLGVIAVAADGTVHVVTGGDGGTHLTYVVRSGDTWSSPQDVTTVITLKSMAIALDGSGTGQVLISGHIDGLLTPPTGCDSGYCTAVITLTASPAATGIVSKQYISLHAIAAGETVDAVGVTGIDIDHLTNDGGSWSSDDVADVTAAEASISRSPFGVSIFYCDANDPGIYRADRTDTGWDISSAPATQMGELVGVLDDADAPHVAARQFYQDEDGGTVAALVLIAPDDVVPNALAPVAIVRRGGIVGTTVPVNVAWPAARDALSGPASYTLSQKTNATWSTVVAKTTGRSAVRALTPGVTAYAFRVRATDEDGNVGAFATGPTFKLTRGLETSTMLTYGGVWRTTTSSKHLNGSVRYATGTGASATIKVTGATGFAWLGTYGPTRGSADIYVDNVKVERVSTYRSATTTRVVIWSIRWSTPGTHTVRIKPAGTPGHARIDVDGYVVVR